MTIAKTDYMCYNRRITIKKGFSFTMTKNQLHKILIQELIKTHPDPVAIFNKMIAEYPEEKDFFERLAKALHIKIK